MSKQPIETVSAHWDTQDPANVGWYAEAYDSRGGYVNDSQKIDWPVDMDAYANTLPGMAALKDALQDAFPCAKIQLS